MRKKSTTRDLRRRWAGDYPVSLPLYLNLFFLFLKVDFVFSIKRFLPAVLSYPPVEKFISTCQQRRRFVIPPIESGCEPPVQYLCILVLSVESVSHSAILTAHALYIQQNRLRITWISTFHHRIRIISTNRCIHHIKKSLFIKPSHSTMQIHSSHYSHPHDTEMDWPATKRLITRHLDPQRPQCSRLAAKSPQRPPATRLSMALRPVATGSK